MTWGPEFYSVRVLFRSNGVYSRFFWATHDQCDRLPWRTATWAADCLHGKQGSVCPPPAEHPVMVKGNEKQVGSILIELVAAIAPHPLIDMGMCALDGVERLARVWAGSETASWAHASTTLGSEGQLSLRVVARPLGLAEEQRHCQKRP